MKIRDADNAVVEITKLGLYCLDAMHPLGAHKARQFAARLGYTSRDAEAIRDKLLEAIRRTTEAELGERDYYGQRYGLDVNMDGPKGTAVVRTTWIARESERGPRLLSCFVVEA